ncbi:PAH dioxygenase small subunit [Halohasta litchfieldiae]|jgi:3-phenylpropionate/cinnamic acid dioxygenase small subunit|uniref:PAH dioxygenase small subunit n=1 Tax=Halohasta litchfieldiae TaxID=1073996 RepID=A0A1H6RVV2_9EURY|nr:aromatic-ring-hydroxylating dioxygenase subunit beta [Halohasta litchfieldiae]ATW89353.1 PAH dioxygenase small subunit [Halohasta litchfieldiae]SEI59988.1 PAH dioxygenase small subunit [Halohasta litchfieldiae]
MSSLSVTETATPVDPETQHSIEQFLYREADLLDGFELEEWLTLLDEDIQLEVPIRVARHPGSERPEFSETTNYLKEDYEMLRERVGRLEKEYAWSENPRSRIRHVIGNVRVIESTDTELTVANNQHVFRSYGDTADHDLLSAQRHTVLRRPDEDGDGFSIGHRTVYLDHTILNTKNLTLPLL